MFSEDQLARYQRHLSDGWIGVDLDGTLAEYHAWDAALKFGKPIPLMVERVKAWLALGLTVKIVTARMPLPDDYDYRPCDVTGDSWSQLEMAEAIANYTEEHVGARLEAVCYKDLYMLELWDDRAVQIVANTGRTLAEEHAAELSALRGAP